MELYLNDLHALVIVLIADIVGWGWAMFRRGWGWFQISASALGSSIVIRFAICIAFFLVIPGSSAYPAVIALSIFNLGNPYYLFMAGLAVTGESPHDKHRNYRVLISGSVLIFGMSVPMIMIDSPGLNFIPMAVLTALLFILSSGISPRQLIIQQQLIYSFRAILKRKKQPKQNQPE